MLLLRDSYHRERAPQVPECGIKYLCSAMISRLFKKITAVSWLSKAYSVVRWSLRILPILILMDVGYLIGIWPDWNIYAEGPAPRSQFILAYELEQSRHAGWRKLRWQPVSIDKIPRCMVRAVIVAEDGRQHDIAANCEEPVP
jgi:membrane peptidoglycan carboxypeptidase